LLSQHCQTLAEEGEASSNNNNNNNKNNTRSRRAALFRLLSSVVGNYTATPSVAGKDSGAVNVTDFLIEQVVNDIEWEQRPADEEVAAELEALRESAEELLVQLASHHWEAVLTRLLARLDGASMFQQQKAQALARFRSRPGTQWFAEKGATPRDHRLIGILSAVEALARGRPEQLSKENKRILAAMLPVVGLATSPASKEAWSRAMCAYCEAVHAHNDELRAAAESCGAAPAHVATVCDASTRMAMLAAYDVVAQVNIPGILKD